LDRESPTTEPREIDVRVLGQCIALCYRELYRLSANERRRKALACNHPSETTMQRLVCSTATALALVTLAMPAAHSQSGSQPPPTNLALGKPAYQSSTAFGMEASRAVDGNIDGNYYSGSITQTLAGGPQWWMVDLGDTYTIDSVIVYNRTDCCADRLKGQVGVAYRTDAPYYYAMSFHLGTLEFNRTPRASVPGSYLLGDACCGRSYGRYIYVFQESQTQPLTLAEVIVIGHREGQEPSAPPQPTPPSVTNVAVGKQASQSSTDYGGLGSRAVDGNADGGFFNGSVTHTATAPNQWWMVDLGASYRIESITVFNRTDCCAERLDAELRVTEEPGWPNNLTFQSALGAHAVRQIPVASAGVIFGRYIWVIQKGTEPLSLAEVVVMGAPRQ
jgi:hypothetical protein